MPTRELSGDEAMAFGAVAAGIKTVSSYPGSPSSGTVQILVGLSNRHDFYIEWSTNEKVAMELGIGASIAGRRALVCAKSVGMNLMLDPLMALNLTPVHGGLVILLGDDPGGYGSQNDQDTRPLIHMLQMPMMEPASPTEGYAMMRHAFDTSERLQTAVIIRETRSYTGEVAPVEIAEGPVETPDLGFSRERFRFVPMPINVVEKNRELHRKISQFRDWAETTRFNSTTGQGNFGVIAAGFAHKKLMDVIGDAALQFRILKLGNLYPLPAQRIVDFLRGCEEILIAEEGLPYVENSIKALAFDHACTIKLYGKAGGYLPQEGELFRWQIQEAIQRLVPEFAPAHNYRQTDEADERPSKEGYCRGCRYDEVLDLLVQAANAANQEIVLVADPGCLVTVAERIDAKYAIGSAVAVADGLSKAGLKERAIAIFGDSSFFHTTLPAILNATQNGSDILLVLLNNDAARTSGFQPHPGSSRDLHGNQVPHLNIESVARACGVNMVWQVNLDDSRSRIVTAFQDALDTRKLGLIIVDILDSKPA